MSCKREAIKVYDAELERWPGVRWSYGFTKRHRKLVMQYAGQQRTHVFATSASDQLARQNGLSEVRRSLRELGAERRP